MLNWLDSSAIEIKRAVTESTRYLWQQKAGSLRGTLLGRGIEFLGSASPFYADPLVLERLSYFEAQIEALLSLQEEPKSLSERAATLANKPLFQLAKKKPFQEIFPDRIQTVETLLTNPSQEALNRFNSYRATSYTIENIRETLQSALENPTLFLLSGAELNEMIQYERSLRIEEALLTYGPLSRDELVKKVTRERDNLYARCGVVPTAGYLVSTGISFINPFAGLAVSAATMALQMRVRPENSDILAAASLLPSATGITSAATAVLMANPVTAAAVAGVAVAIDLTVSANSVVE